MEKQCVLMGVSYHCIKLIYYTMKTWNQDIWPLFCLLRDGRNAASSFLCAQPLLPRSEMYGDTSGYKVWTLPWRNGGQRHPLHWCGRGRQRHDYTMGRYDIVTDQQLCTELAVSFNLFRLTNKQKLNTQIKSLIKETLSRKPLPSSPRPTHMLWHDDWNST